MPSPVRKRPARAKRVPGEIQNSGNPRSATKRVMARRIAGGSVRAKRLLAIRPTSIAAKKAVREVAAAGRVRPVPSARKSAPQYPTHHSEATPSATSQPSPDAADAPTRSGATIAQALAVTLDSVRATALYSPCLSERTAWEVMSTRAPQMPMAKVAGTVPQVLGLEIKNRAPAATPNAPPQSTACLPQRLTILSPKNPSNTAPRAKALKWRLAAA